jgi:hypothetical protein
MYVGLFTELLHGNALINSVTWNKSVIHTTDDTWGKICKLCDGSQCIEIPKYFGFHGCILTWASVTGTEKCNVQLLALLQ